MRYHIQQSRRGSAILIATVVVFAILVMSAAFLAIATAQAHEETTAENHVRALYIAEAGVSHAILDLTANRAQNPQAGNLGSANGPIVFGGGDYYVTATTVAPETYLLKSVGHFGDVTRAVEVVVSPDLSLPTKAAMTIFGSAKEVEFEIDPENGAQVDINGLPGRVPAITVQAPTSFDQVRDQLLEQISNGEVNPAKIKGLPELPYTLEDGTVVHIALTQSDTVRFDGAFMEQVRQALIEQAVSDWIPNADRTFTDDMDIRTAMQFGSRGNPEVVVIRGADVDIKDGGSVTGHGILIITGELQVGKLGRLDWDGTVLVLGGNNDFGGDAEFENHRGIVNIGNAANPGNLIVIGSDGGQAEFEIDDPGGNSMSNTNVHGTVMTLAGPGEEAEVEIEEGATVINGLLFASGHEEVEFELENEDDVGEQFRGVLNVNGAVAVGVASPGGEIEIEMEGNANLTYHPNNVARALQGLEALVTNILRLPLPLTMRSWREVSP